MHEPTYTIMKCYDNEVPPEFRTQTQYSGVAYVCWYIRSGSVTVETTGRKLHAQPGDWVFVEPLTTKSQTFSTTARIVSIRFGVNWNNLHFFPPLRAPWKAAAQECPGLLEAATEFCAYEAILTEATGTWSPAMYATRAALFNAWLSHWHRLRGTAADGSAPSMDARVAAIFTELMRSPGVAPVDYQALSQSTGLSAAQINRIFKQSTGQTPKGWKDTACLKIAEDMLGRDQHSIKEIAAELGFCDASHFSKWFRQQMNHTPSRWRTLQQA